MSEADELGIPIIPPSDPFLVGEDELPPEQAAAKRPVEAATQAAVMPFETEKHAVTQDHVGAQARVWGPRDDQHRPVELSTDGRNG